MPRKPSRPKTENQSTVVTYNVGQSTYQIDPQRQKVYRRFVEIETSKAFEIYTSWRAQNLSV